MNPQLRKLAGIISPRLAGASDCEACGKQFKCGASLRGCWCSEIQLRDEMRALLKLHYRRCLCRACLEELAGDGLGQGKPLRC